MKMTNEKNWTANEKKRADDLRAEGNKVRVTIRNGRRVFEIVAAEDGARPAVHLGGTAFRIREPRTDSQPLRGVLR